MADEHVGEPTGPTMDQRREMAIAKRNTIEDTLNKAVPKIQALLPRGMLAKKLLQIVLNSCTKNPKLLECKPLSILGAVMQSAELGLTPDGLAGEAHIIPFKNNKKGGIYEAQFIPGYKGLIKLAMNSGQVKRFQARVVYDKDIFDYELGINEYLKHKPTGETEKPIHFYAILEFLNGGVIFDVLPTKKIESIRDASPNYKYARDKTKTIWAQYFPDMGMKTMIRRLAKYAPLSPEFQRAVALDEQFEQIGNSQELDLHLTEYELLPDDDKNDVVGNAALAGEKQDEGEGGTAGGAGEDKGSGSRKRAVNAAQQTLNMMEGKK